MVRENSVNSYYYYERKRTINMANANTLRSNIWPSHSDLIHLKQRIRNQRYLDSEALRISAEMEIDAYNDIYAE